MKLGMIGLGRMGGNMAERLRRAGHEVVGYDRNPAVSETADLADLDTKDEAGRSQALDQAKASIESHTVTDETGTEA